MLQYHLCEREIDLVFYWLDRVRGDWRGRMEQALEIAGVVMDPDRAVIEIANFLETGYTYGEARDHKRAWEALSDWTACYIAGVAWGSYKSLSQQIADAEQEVEDARGDVAYYEDALDEAQEKLNDALDRLRELKAKHK